MWGEERPSSAVWQFQAVCLEVLLLIQALISNRCCCLFSLGAGGWTPLWIWDPACSRERAWGFSCCLQAAASDPLWAKEEVGAQHDGGKEQGARGPGARCQGWISVSGNTWVANPAAVGRHFLLLHGSWNTPLLLMFATWRSCRPWGGIIFSWVIYTPLQSEVPLGASSCALTCTAMFFEDV